MNRPQIICHILQSVDGNIDGAFFASPACRLVLPEHGRIREEYDCDAVISGAVTAAEIYADGFIEPDTAGTHDLPRTDRMVSHYDRYAVIIDGTGTVDWKQGIVERKGKKMQVITVLQENVPDAYLLQLQKAGVAYLFAGESALDLTLAAEKLKTQYGIRKMLLAGGGKVDWAFLQAGLIDEISLVIPPLADGGTGLASAFDKSSFVGGNPIQLKLLDVQILLNDAVWIRYKPLSVSNS